MSNICYRIESFSSWCELEREVSECALLCFHALGYVVGDGFSNAILGYSYHVSSVACSVDSQRPEIWVNTGMIDVVPVSEAVKGVV